MLLRYYDAFAAERLQRRVTRVYARLILLRRRYVICSAFDAPSARHA